MKVLEYIQSESDRQSATLQETIGMVNAWSYVRGFKTGVPNLETICHISMLITGNSVYRVVPAVFNQGSPAIEASLIPRAMENWHRFVAVWIAVKNLDSDDLDNAMTEFLNIHPFADGNGRVASLLYNHFKGTILDPVPLPYYFGDGPVFQKTI